MSSPRTYQFLLGQTHDEAAKTRGIDWSDQPGQQSLGPLESLEVDSDSESAFSEVSPANFGKHSHPTHLFYLRQSQN
jgi:hypothetical protein